MLAYLRQKGAHIIDADQLAHQAIAPGGPAYDQVISTFGVGIVLPDGAIDRRTLGRIVFGDPAALAQLEAIVHPAVFTLAQTEFSASTAPVIIIEAIKLLESGRLLSLCNEVWVITATTEAQLTRLLHDRGMSEAEARQRMAAQSTQADKIKRATRVIDNSTTPEALYTQLDVIWNDLVRKA